ncbi:uncharacterized protein LOC117568683 [Drosophila albomicans]|uniref:Uncharacterized protein LOC117568683 n=1 Tax=Drosophila albomicans TaxID=7291 RepID=A0A6P8YBM6_DROAB|nr:uncharacterized protein LOC117568683 [Drosophila albomicans]
MWLSNRNAQIAIGLMVYGLALITHTLPFPWNEGLETMRDLEFVATLSLLFGILKAHPKHRAKLMLGWLVITVFCFLSMLNTGVMIICPRVDRGPVSFIWILISWSLAGVVAHLWIIMYNEYVELTIGAEQPVEEVHPKAQEALRKPSLYPNTENLTISVHGKPVEEVDAKTQEDLKKPSPYPNTENLTILVHGKRMEI